MAAGTYVLKAKATDSKSATATSTTVTVTVTKVVKAYYIDVDHLNTPRAVTNSTGAAVWTWDNVDPYGANVPNENPGGLGAFAFNLRFPGQYFDKETSTHYNYFRDYDPAVGRYVESDLIGLGGGVNTYTYVNGNSLSFIDPFGLDATNWWNNAGGRNPVTDGPTNGNWGGGKWSGGVGGGGVGTAPALDGGDECYQRHDQCFDSGTSKASCNRKLVEELKALLPDDPRTWPRSPRADTEGHSRRYRNWAIEYFQ